MHHTIQTDHCTPVGHDTDSHRAARYWQPLLDDKLQQRAWATINEIAETLSTPQSLSRATDQAMARPGDPAAMAHLAAQNSLALGATGVAIFFAYLAKVEAAQRNQAIAVNLLEQVLTRLALAPSEPTLYSGYTGVAWTLAHLDWLIAAEVGDPNAEVDQALLALLTQAPWQDDYDLIVGLVGFGVYALERLPQPAAVACLTRVIDHLDQLAMHTPVGITWPTPAQRLPPDICACHPDGIYNLGVAHGVPGIIGLLGSACAAGVAVAQARPLLDGAVRWLLAQPQGDGCTVGFPSETAAGMIPVPARLAWCYGDPGIAATLLAVARAVGEPGWEAAALRIARRAAQRAPAQAGVNDAGLCHGAAGLGHLFNRMFQATGDPVLGEAARYWFAQTLEMRRPGQGLAGYATWTPGQNSTFSLRNDPGFLTGIAGIALALLAAITPIEPNWDRVLLVAVPPQPLAVR